MTQCTPPRRLPPLHVLTSAAGAFDVAEAVADDFISAHYQCKWAASSTRQGVPREGGGRQDMPLVRPQKSLAKSHTHTL